MNLNNNFQRLHVLTQFLLFLILAFSTALPVFAEESADKPQNSEVDLHYFWSRYCPHCREAKPFIEKLPKTYSWLNLHSYDLVGSRLNQQRYLMMAEQLGQTAKSVPGFIFCGQMMVGYDKAETTGRELETRLLDCYRQQEDRSLPAQENFTLPWFGNVHYQDFSLPVFTLIIAALDAFNPCAFFVLFFLLSLMVHHRSRIRMLAVGTIFVICSGIMYFLFMAAWLNLFLLTEQLMMITAAAGVIAISFGLINIKDYFFFQQGISLSLTEDAKTKLFERIRLMAQTGSWPALIIATMILAVAANSYELLCTAGLPMVFTRVLTLNELPVSQYYLYLLLYNAIYIVPLLLIVVAFALTLGNRKLTEQEGRLLKLLSGSMMLGLGTILLLKPEWLSNMMVSVVVIFGAILLTFFVSMLQRLKPKYLHRSKKP